MCDKPKVPVATRDLTVSPDHGDHGLRRGRDANYYHASPSDNGTRYYRPYLDRAERREARVRRYANYPDEPGRHNF